MIEQPIFENLLYNEEYGRKVLPFIKAEYFQNKNDQILFNVIKEYTDKYNSFPAKTALLIEIGNLSSITDDQAAQLKVTITSLEDKPVDLAWILDETEKFCQDRAVYNAIYKSINILDGGKNINEDKGAIPEILSEALAVSFDTNVGHDFLDDFESRYDFYHKKENKVGFDLDHFNRITKGGIPNKTLNVVLAGTGVGKSLFMCHCAASNLTKGLNVLYITMEMAEERIAERIDANLLNTSLDELSIMPKDVYAKKVSRIKSHTTGKLIIKEYPTASAGAGHFRHLLNELRLKKNFIPQIIYIDYLNICASSRLKSGSNVNSYTYIKAIAEELRGLAVEHDVPIMTATQTTRSGYSSSDIGLEDTSESFGLPATADFMFALSSDEELQSLNQMMVKQLKNRYNDPTSNRRFVIGVDRAKMKLYDVEQTAQNDIVNDKPAFDNSSSGVRVNTERKFDKSTFDSFS
jgi:archaellum biogenesis ATPase FlaH